MGSVIGTVGAVFLYIVNDFSTSVLSSSDFTIHGAFSIAAYTLIAFVIVTSQGVRLKRISEDPLYLLAHRLGEKKHKSSQFLAYLNLRNVVTTIALLGVFALPFYDSLGLRRLVALALAFMALGLVISRRERAEKREFKRLQKELPRNAVVALAVWRLRQILPRRLIGIGLVSGFIVFSAGLFYLSTTSARFLSVVALFASAWGLWLGWNMLKQVVIDAGYPWLELNAGVSHQSYINAYRLISLAFVTPWIMSILIVVLLLALFNVSVSSNLILFSIVALITPPLLVPSFCLQISPRSLSVNFLVLFMISIFLVSGFFLNPFVTILLPIIMHYGAVLQNDRFYRIGAHRFA